MRITEAIRRVAAIRRRASHEESEASTYAEEVRVESRRLRDESAVYREVAREQRDTLADQ